MYIFAKTFNIPRLRQDAMDRLVWCNNFTCDSKSESRHSEYISTAAIWRAYEHTERNSPLRKWLTGRNFHYVTGRATVDLPKEYSSDLVKKYGAMETPDMLHIVCMTPGCELHEHETQEDTDDCVIRVKMERKLKR
jgi:hypothetical protein